MTDIVNTPMPPFNRHLGFEIVQWHQDSVVIIAGVKPEYRNHSNGPHGGLISTLLDSAGALSGLYSHREDWLRRAFTLSLNISFVGQSAGSRLKAVGELTASGRKIFFSTSKVYDGEDTLVAIGQGVFRYRTGSELGGGPGVNSGELDSELT